MNVTTSSQQFARLKCFQTAIALQTERMPMDHGYPLARRYHVCHKSWPSAYVSTAAAGRLRATLCSTRKARMHAGRTGEDNRARPQRPDRSRLRGDTRGIVNRLQKIVAPAVPVAMSTHVAILAHPTSSLSA